MSAENWSFETQQIHAGAQPDPTTGARAVPIYQTTSYVFRDTDHAAALFALGEPGNIYTRIGNPTQDVFEQRITALEGGIGALALTSGQAAETLGILNLAEVGDHVVSSSSLYGGTYNLFHYTLPKLGIEVTFVADPDDLEEWRDAVRPNTKAFYGETIGNPRGDILDTAGVSEVAHAAGVPLIVDNTLATLYLYRPLEHGADIVVHSATKFIGGHGTAIGGVIVDGGRFDFGASGRFSNFTTPDPSYHGLVYWEALGHGSYIAKARVQLLRDIGASISPFTSFLLLQGLETLSLRVERHTANAQRVAEWLEARDEVSWVTLSGAAVVEVVLPGAAGAAARRRGDPVIRYRRRGRGRTEVRRGGGAVQPPGQRRRRAFADHSPGDDDALPAHRDRAGRDRCHPGPDPAVGRHRGDRRHPRRPRHRVPCRQELSRGAPVRTCQPGRRRGRHPPPRPCPSPGRGGPGSIRSGGGASPRCPARCAWSSPASCRVCGSPTRPGDAWTPRPATRCSSCTPSPATATPPARPAPGIRQKAGGMA